MFIELVCISLKKRLFPICPIQCVWARGRSLRRKLRKQRKNLCKLQCSAMEKFETAEKFGYVTLLCNGKV